MQQRNKARWQASLRGTLLLLWIVILIVAGKTGDKAVHAQIAPTSSPKIYLPVINNGAAVDLAINRVEVTQAVQDSQNSVVLVAGRPTMLRIYTSGTGFNQMSATVHVSISVKSTSNTLATVPQILTTSIPLSSSQANYASTINYRLPASWLSGVEDVTIKLDADNTLQELSKANNTYTIHLAFNPVPPLEVKIVPIQYTDTYDNYTYPAPSTDTISDWIMRTYPISQVHITWHAPVAFTGDLTTSTDFSSLLSKVTSIKNAENAPAAQVYYGLIPTANGSKTWFHAGIAGIGWVSSRAAIGLDLSGQASQIAAHEIGHNLGMQHAPCGSASGVDPLYPYASGAIGQYGLDVTTGQVYSPATKDVMSYCTPKWISDYTYKILYASQVKYGALSVSGMTVQGEIAGTARRSLLLRANLTAQGAELLPVYVLSGSQAANPESGDYQVQVLGANGETLAQVPVKAYSAGEPGEAQLSSIQALIPLSDTPAARVRLFKDGVLLAEQSLQTVTMNKVAGMTVSAVSGGFRVRWTATTQPVMLRYTADNGATWTTLEMDFQGSEFTVPAASLPAPNGTFEVVQSGVWK